MTALTVIDNENNVEAYRASTNAASICKEIVVATASNIQGRRYVSVEGWQAIAVAHGCAAGSRDVERIEGGFRAIGEVRRMADGQLIATAEGFVGEDESTWFGGDNGRGRTLPKRPDYAIRAMAQTRAISRACRSAFAHVVVMMNAGLATTPAEEVPHGGFDDSSPNVEPANDAPPEKLAGITKIKERLRELQTKGDAAPDLETFNALVHGAADDLTKIKDARHDWWTGDGGEMEGFRAWIVRRREELSPDNMVSRMIADMKEQQTKLAYSRWLGAHNDVIEALDGADSRRFQLACDLHEIALGAEATVTAG